MRVDLGSQMMVIQRSEAQKARSGQNQDQNKADASFSAGEEGFLLEGKVYGPNGRFVNLKMETARAHLKSYVRDLLWQQAIALKEMTADEADLATADSGDWGADKIAQRVLDFTKRVAGDDSAMYSRLRDAAVKGFDEAKRIFGGWLPEISENTFEKVTKGFDELEKPSAA